MPAQARSPEGNHHESILVEVVKYILSKRSEHDMLQRDATAGIGVTAQTTAGNPKRHTPRQRAGPRARTNHTDRKHTNKAQSSRQRQEAPNAHRGGQNNATATPQGPRWLQVSTRRIGSAESAIGNQLKPTQCKTTPEGGQRPARKNRSAGGEGRAEPACIPAAPLLFP